MCSRARSTFQCALIWCLHSNQSASILGSQQESITQVPSHIYILQCQCLMPGLYLTKIIVPVLLSTKVEGSCCTIACPATSTHHFMYFHMPMKYANTTYNFHLPSFAWCDEYTTLSTLVNSNSPSVVQHKNSAVFAVTDEKLLCIQLPRQPTKNCVVFIRDD